MLYATGDGVDTDLDEAIKWFKRASLVGNEDGMRHLNLLVDLGIIPRSEIYDE